MNVHALVAAAACAVSLFVGVWHLLVYRRGTRDPMQLAFALACFAIGLFDMCRIGSYLEYRFKYSGFAQLGEHLFGALMSIPLLWFILLTRRERLNRLHHAVFAYFGCAALAIVLAPKRWLLSSMPRIIPVDLPWGDRLTYWEFDHGPLLRIITNCHALVISAVVLLIARPLKSDDPQGHQPMRLLRIGMTVFLLGALNDIFVSRQLYRFFYVMEVAYLGLVLVVTWGMSNSVIELAATRAELRREHRRLARILDNIDEIYFEATLSGIVKEISPSVRRLTGIETNVRGTEIRSYYQNPADHEDIVARLRLDGKVSHAETRLLFADGQPHPVELNAVLVRDDETGEQLILGSMRDITERKATEAAKADLEQQLQQAQKLESLGVLAGGIAHDFNNLLAGILGSTELAKLRLGKHHPVLEVLDVTVQSSLRAAELCRLMLAYSGRGRSTAKRMDLSDAVRAIRDLLAISVKKQTTLEYQLSPDVLTIEADGAQLNQVLLNLVINASEALVRGIGRVRVSTRAATIVADPVCHDYLREPIAAGHYAVLEVVDEGVGMNEETRRKLFDPFFTTKFSGRGLGLAAVLGIVRSHRGAIQVESELDKGSTFRVFFPCSSEPLSQEDFAVTRSEPWMGRGRAAIFDDEPEVCETTAQMLELMGFQAVTFLDAEAGVAEFEREPQHFELAIVDVTMPRMSGDEVHHRLRRCRPDLPIVMFSGYCEEDVLPHDARAQRTTFVQKPFTFEAMRDKVRSVVDQTMIG